MTFYIRHVYELLQLLFFALLKKQEIVSRPSPSNHSSQTPTHTHIQV